MSNNVKNVLVVGTGEIAGEYCKILKSMGIKPDVVGRNEEKAIVFGKKNDVNAFGGGIEKFMQGTHRKYDYGIVATNITELKKATCCLIYNGIKYIFSEKPGGLNKQELLSIDETADKHDAEVYIGYNRRFYSSTEKALEIIGEDGGVKSFNFEFTEWSHIIEPMEEDMKIKQEWFLCNSSHVVDLAFFLGGEPKEMNSFISGEMSWYKKGRVFAGAGVSDKGALFSYQANWNSPGRWGVEILTDKHRLYFRPMEKLSIQEIGSVEIKSVEIDDKYDIEYKPGFYKEVKSFIYNIDDGKKKTLKDQVKYMDYFRKIEGIIL